MKVSSKMISVFFALLFTLQVMAADNVAKVIILRGQVKAKLANGTMIDVKLDQSIPEGATVQTADKSFVKLLFIDKSQMNLGPNSQMVINAFPKKEAGIITLVKGQIRSQVTKDYMEMDDKSKSKLYIKTKTAAMGIRGTDFQVNYNEANQNTSLITFEGKVAMSHIERSLREERFNQDTLEGVITGEKAVFVTQGQVSAVNLNIAERAMTPTKLGIRQIEALEKNETGLSDTTQNDSKQYRNPIPPGASGAAFSNNVNTGRDNSADGYFNVSTGEYKLPAGSIIDLKTVNIIPPPSNAIFDNNTGTYSVPESLGKIDKNSGEYRAPEGLKLEDDGKFKIVDMDAFTKSQAVKEEDKAEKPEETKENKKDEKKDGDKREPNSVSPTEANVKAPEILSGSGAQNFISTFATPASGAPGAGNPANRENLAGIASEILQRNDVAKQTATDRGTAVQKTKVKFILNAR